MKRYSLTYQVNMALKSLHTLKKKKSNKSAEKRQAEIYHGTTMKTYVARACTFAKWCKEKYGIKYLAEITPDMGAAYINFMENKNLSAYYIANTISALAKLEKGIQKQYHHRTHIISKDIKRPQRKLENRIGRQAYTEEELSAIIKEAEKIDPLVATAIEIQAAFGLRITELLKLRVTDVHFARNKLIVWRGKGGRLREVPIESKEVIAKLKEICAGKAEEDLLLHPLTNKDYYKAYKKACDQAEVGCHKTHNLRHTYALKQYLTRKTKGFTEQKAREETSQLLGHNRVDVISSYLPTRLR